jgi:hypothetical protein
LRRAMARSISSRSFDGLEEEEEEAPGNNAKTAERERESERNEQRYKVKDSTNVKV